LRWFIIATSSMTAAVADPAADLPAAAADDPFASLNPDQRAAV